MLLSTSTDEVCAGWVPAGRMEILLISDGQTAAWSAVRREGREGVFLQEADKTPLIFQDTVATTWHSGAFVFEMRVCAVPPMCVNA